MVFLRSKALTVVIWICSSTTLSAQERPLPFDAELAEIQAAREAALAQCQTNFSVALQRAQDEAMSAPGVLGDRDALIGLLGDLGADITSLNRRSDDQLLNDFGSLTITQLAACNTDAHQAATAALQGIGEIIQRNIAALREETATFQDILFILDQLEAYSDGDAPIQLEIDAVRGEVARLQQSITNRREAIAAMRVEIEAIRRRIASGATN